MGDSHDAGEVCSEQIRVDAQPNGEKRQGRARPKWDKFKEE
jgi:hypothetical protein